MAEQQFSSLPGTTHNFASCINKIIRNIDTVSNVPKPLAIFLLLGLLFLLICHIVITLYLVIFLTFRTRHELKKQIRGIQTSLGLRDAGKEV
ncbi:uncharacterized protein LY89DRAFT_683617 [Mollisia scopiformis]|uniref:Uncharacterized protein n=1 Tax=Mollisia scopiformis TaxID=149040 RepID=A0A194XEX9_MOLSC|nr:uncharacterized protein LY89DRAFT_683617 [Mollisia scopiformis]KUJ18723.1 hypothetical protein LY89DRAFT_683617 [Mollisia scopiformis]